MTVEETYLKGCYLIKPTTFHDERGYFYESFNTHKLRKGINWNGTFVQDNVSMSKKGVLRGLHFQLGNSSQAKLVSVLKGAVLDVAVDLRASSATFGNYFKTVLDDRNKLQLFIPKGFAHGFLTLSEEAIFCYKCDAFYNMEAESGIRFNDETLAIDWGIPHSDLIISSKDKLLKSFKECIPFQI
ncbi:dTDP-4-dehydrorhamnose 3,5-epimerase [Ascidiimonas sp. W6]|uniref:dTDP-4-dehydrorhamnose 3,5-epimerase n=1 Tax=Ascidiimonas meishanensis TaxID=3128903 RepID=UPI0030EDE493